MVFSSPVYGKGTKVIKGYCRKNVEYKSRVGDFPDAAFVTLELS